MAEEKTKCPDCDGKGHRMSILAAFFFALVGAVLAAMETDNPNGVTREQCERCGGTGYLPTETIE